MEDYRKEGQDKFLSIVQSNEAALASSHRILGSYLTKQALELLFILYEKSCSIDKPWNIAGGVECCFMDIANELVGLGLARREWENEPEFVVATLRGMMVAKEMEAEGGAE